MQQFWITISCNVDLLHILRSATQIEPESCWHFAGDESGIRRFSLTVDSNADGPLLLNDHLFLWTDATDSFLNYRHSWGWKRFNQSAWAEVVEV